MQISVTFRHSDPSDAVRTHAEEKVSRAINKYLKQATEAHVILSVEKHRRSAEINVHATNFDISAHETTHDMYEAVDKAVTKLEAQLRKHKDRINHHKGGQHLGGAPTMIPVEVYELADGEDARPTVIETDNIPAKPLTVEDAIVQLELSHQNFLVFRNSVTNDISVVYRRTAGNFGLIAPGN